MAAPLAPTTPHAFLDAVLRREAGSPFADAWYRVGPTRPALTTHARISRQRFGGHTHYIIEDPAGGQYYRLSEPAYRFVGLLDGRHTADEAWEACNAQLGDDAPTQRECIELISKLQLWGLVTSNDPLAPEMIEMRRRDARKQRLARRTGRWLSPTIPIINPDRWLEAAKPLLRAVFSRWGAIAWLVVVGIAFYRVFVRRDALVGGFNSVLDPANLPWLAAVFLLVRGWHELGHTAAAKAMGARCTEMGLMFVAYVLPFPYCDTSSAWRLGPVWQRVVVSAGGMLFETFVAGLAAIVWSFGDEHSGGLTRALLYNVMLLSGVTTIIFNANPLLRYDGYYILSDLTGSANLAQRSAELLRFYVLRFVFRVTTARPPNVRGPGELWLLSVYGLLAAPYRIVVAFSIVLVIWSNPAYLSLGAVLGAAAVAVWIVWPVLRAVGFVFFSNVLLGHRARAVTILGATLAALIVLLGVIPLPARAIVPGVVEPLDEEPLRTREDGFIARIHVAPGETVTAGTPLVTMHNAQLVAEAAAARALVLRAEADASAAAGGASQTLRIQAERVLTQARRDAARAAERVDSLTLRAGVAGRVVPSAGRGGDKTLLQGTFQTRGTLLGSVASTSALIVRCVVPDADHAYIFRSAAGEELAGGGPRVAVRVKGSAWRQMNATVMRVTPAGSRKLVDTTLSTRAGGDVAMDPTDPKGESSVSPQFVVEVVPGEPPVGWQPGLRARVRFSVPPQPLLAQWWRRGRQYLSAKVGW